MMKVYRYTVFQSFTIYVDDAFQTKVFPLGRRSNESLGWLNLEHTSYYLWIVRGLWFWHQNAFVYVRLPSGVALYTRWRRQTDGGVKNDCNMRGVRARRGELNCDIYRLKWGRSTVNLYPLEAGETFASDALMYTEWFVFLYTDDNHAGWIKKGSQ